MTVPVTPEMVATIARVSCAVADVCNEERAQGAPVPMVMAGVMSRAVLLAVEVGVSEDLLVEHTRRMYRGTIADVRAAVRTGTTGLA